MKPVYNTASNILKEVIHLVLLSRVSFNTCISIKVLKVDARLYTDVLHDNRLQHLQNGLLAFVPRSDTFSKTKSRFE